MSTSVSGVSKHFPSPQNGFQTTLASNIASGATNVPLSSIGAYANGDVVVLVVDPLSANTKQVFTGTVDTTGNQITNVVWTAGTNQPHAGGVTVVDYVTATHMAMVSKGIQVVHKQDGTLKDSVVGTTNLVAAAVTKEKLDKPHYGKMYYNNGGTTGGEVFGTTQRSAAFTAFDDKSVGVTASGLNAAGSYMTIARDGIYRVSVQSASADQQNGSGFQASLNSFITWIYLSFDNGANYNQIRESDRTIFAFTYLHQDWQGWLPAGTRIKHDVYCGTGNVRMSAPGSPTTDQLYCKSFGPYISVTEVR